MTAQKHIIVDNSPSDDNSDDDNSNDDRTSQVAPDFGDVCASFAPGKARLIQASFVLGVLLCPRQHCMRPRSVHAANKLL